MQVEAFLLSYYRSIPVISRVLFSISIILTALTYLDIVSPYNLVYSFPHIKEFEIWRALTSFFYLGPATLDTLVHHFFMLKYCMMLEEAEHNPADFLYLVIVGMGMILVGATFLGMSKLSSALSTYIIYIWSKRNPLIIVQYMGIFSIPAYYIPWIMFIFSFLSERALPLNDTVGIAAGHIYFYFKTVYTRTNRTSDPLRTPQILKNIFIKAKELEKREQPAEQEVNRGRPRITTLDNSEE